jgi:predicted DNA-binding transcriptional regulator AlpA
MVKTLTDDVEEDQELQEPLDTGRIQKGHWHCPQELRVDHYFRDKQMASASGLGISSIWSLLIVACGNALPRPFKLSVRMCRRKQGVDKSTNASNADVP